MNTLQELTLALVDIHSQHQNLSLNDTDYLRWIIDSYAGVEQQTRELNKQFEAYSELKRSYQHARESYLEDQKNLDYLTHQFQELAAARLIAGELATLEEYADTLSHAADIKLALEASSAALDHEEQGSLIGLKHLLHELEKVRAHLPAAHALWQRAQEAYIELRDISSEVQRESDRIEVDPARLEEVNARINLLNTLLV